MSSLLGTFGANSAPKVTPASVSGQVWSFQSPLGIVYGIIPHEEVDYPSARPAGTIIINTSQRRLYYLLGGGRATRYTASRDERALEAWWQCIFRLHSPVQR